MKGQDLEPGLITHCQVCGSDQLEPILDLGHQAPCDSLIWPDQLNKTEKTHPLRFVVCKSCFLGQIDFAVDPKELFFPEYPYRSGITPTLVEKLSKTAESTLSRFPLSAGSLVMDIGSNDGTVLKAFQNRGMKVLGDEATNIAKLANELGIETIQNFFSEALSHEIIAKYGNAEVIAATNVFAHISQLGNILRGISNVLKEGGVFVNESHYLLDLIDTVQYDSIYHEHLRYYSLKSLIILFERFNFTVVDVERIGNYGGSIRVFARKGKGFPIANAVKDMLDLEESFGLYKLSTFQNFAKKAIQARNDLLKLVVNEVSAGKKIVGIGCPGRASTLVNFTGLDSNLMSYIGEQNTSLKLGLFLPGKHVPIIDEAEMFQNQPDYAIMLSWHYAKPIIKKLREKGFKSKIIIPLPEVTIDEV